MFLERKIRKPLTLEGAQTEFRSWCLEHGYVIQSLIHAYWQHNLFYPELDVIVEAQVKKGKK